MWPVNHKLIVVTTFISTQQTNGILSNDYYPDKIESLASFQCESFVIVNVLLDLGSLLESIGVAAKSRTVPDLRFYPGILTSCPGILTSMD